MHAHRRFISTVADGGRHPPRLAELLLSMTSQAVGLSQSDPAIAELARYLSCVKRTASGTTWILTLLW